MNLIKKIEQLKKEFLPIQQARKDVIVSISFTFRDVPLAEIREFAEMRQLRIIESGNRIGVSYMDLVNDMSFCAWSKPVKSIAPPVGRFDHYRELTEV